MASSAAIEGFDARPRRIAGQNPDGRNQVGRVVEKQCSENNVQKNNVQPRRYASGIHDATCEVVPFAHYPSVALRYSSLICKWADFARCVVCLRSRRASTALLQPCPSMSIWSVRAPGSSGPCHSPPGYASHLVPLRLPARARPPPPSVPCLVR